MGVISVVYSGISFLLELWVFVMFTGQVIFDMVYKFLFPPEPKSLDGEVILVSNPHLNLNSDLKVGKYFLETLYFNRSPVQLPVSVDILRFR